MTSVITKNVQNITIMQITVIGKMKDETCGVPIKGFVGLKSKVYCFITEGNHKTEKAKTLKNAAADELKYEDCKNALCSRSYNTWNEQHSNQRS